MSYVKRCVSSHFWDDNYVVNLDPIEKLLFLYFLTNPLSRISGFYEISLKRIAFDTGIDKEMVLKIIKRFEKDGKVFYYKGFIILPNYPKFQSLNHNMIKAVKKDLEEAPELLKAFEGFQRLLKHCQSLWNINIEFKLKKKKEIKKKEEKRLPENFEGQESDASVNSHACLYLSEFKNVKLTQEQYKKLQSRFNKEIIDEVIEELGAYIASKGRRYKSHYATLLNWVKRKSNKSPPIEASQLKVNSEDLKLMKERLRVLEKYSSDSSYREEAEKLRKKIAFLEKNRA